MNSFLYGRADGKQGKNARRLCVHTQWELALPSLEEVRTANANCYTMRPRVTCTPSPGEHSKLAVAVHVTYVAFY